MSDGAGRGAPPPPELLRGFLHFHSHFHSHSPSREMRSLEPVGGGMSGAEIWRLAAAGGSFALRRWPESTAEARVAEVHRLLRHLHAAGCHFVPLPLPFQNVAETTRGPADAPAASWCVWDGAIWELAPWMPGAPCRDPLRSPDTLEACLDAIAAVHRALQPLASIDCPAPAVVDRLRRLEQLEAIGIARISAALNDDPRPPRRRAAARLREVWDQQRARLLHPAPTSLMAPVRCQWVVRDLQAEHLLLTGAEVTGLVDFDALRVDTPAADLARWVGSFAIEESAREGLWQQVLDGYARRGPFSKEEAALARWLDRATTLIALANWVVWLGLERRHFPAGPAAVDQRLERLLQRLGG